MGNGTARRQPVPAGLPRLFRRSRTCGASHDAAGKFPADSLLFTGKRAGTALSLRGPSFETALCASSGRGRAYGERVLKREFVAAAGALRHAQKQLVERD